MSKMDRQLNSKKDKETIYEIYRACRLCGAGAGYKMPIIQSVVDVDDTEVELKQKVREVVQIEVHQDDKMPPLICELCVDKVNDFYEFLEMCRQTNKRTRLRLGLPPQSLPRGAPDAGECILGLTEPVYVNEDSDGEPLSKQKKMNPKVKVKREPELKVRLENRILTESRSTRNSKRSPTPPRMTRHRTTSKDDVPLTRLKDKAKETKPSPKSAPKSILKKDTKNEDNSLLVPRLKRSRDKEPAKQDTPSKRVKIVPKPSPPTPKSSPILSPRIKSKPVKISPKRAPSPPRTYKCCICGQANKSAQANSSHLRSHTVGYTSLRLACNPCGVWFPTPEEATAHHKTHRNKTKPYQCRYCEETFKQLAAYDEHIENKDCIPFYEVPDLKCDECWHLFATNKLLDEHKCLGEDHRPGGKCSKCKRSYTLLKNLKKHELTCTAKKKGELTVDPVLLSKLKPIQIRVSRCDPLLTNLKQEHYDVSNVTADFGLDKNCVYPYISSYSRLRIKSDPDGMVDINAEFKDGFCSQEDYIHWDSEDSDSENDGSSSPSLVLSPFAKKKKIDTLANLTLKTIFSKKCLGKVPKKKRKVKNEKMFDSLLVGSEDDVTRDINNIIDNLGDDDDEFDGDSQKGDESLTVGDGSQKAGDESQKEDGENQVGDESQKVDDESQKDDSKDLSDADKSMDVSDDKVNVSSDKDISNVDDNEKNNDNVSLTDNSLEKTEQNAQNNDKLSEVNEKNDENISEDKDSATKNFNSGVNDSNGSNNNISSNNDNNKRVEDKINNGINSFSFDYFDGDVVSKPESESQKNDTKIDSENSQDSTSIGGLSESLLNENTQSDGTSLSDKETNDKVANVIDNATSLAEPNSDVENKSHSNEVSVDNLSQDSEMPESEVKTNDSSPNEEQSESQNQDESQNLDESQNQTESQNENESQKDNNSQNVNESQNQRNENVTETDYKNAISVIVNCGKNKNATESEEMDDSKLMEALDAQIGDSNENSRENTNAKSQNENFNEKIALDDILSAKSNDNMEGYQDFNFDA